LTLANVIGGETARYQMADLVRGFDIFTQKRSVRISCCCTQNLRHDLRKVFVPVVTFAKLKVKLRAKKYYFSGILRKTEECSLAKW